MNLEHDQSPFGQIVLLINGTSGNANLPPSVIVAL
jgi:hypothetical protein